METTETAMLHKLNKDMYLGNGKPAVTIRLALLEQEQENVKELLEKQEKLISKILWLATTSVIGILIEIILKVILK